MNVINVENITKIYGDKLIFQEASLGIQEGEKIGIVGINGTGKSTFLKLIAGLEEPDEGQVVCQNGRKMAYLPQNPTMPMEWTIKNYMEQCPEPWKAESILNRLGIMEQETLLGNLSGGQRRKVALAKVLAEDFDILLLDEPTNHLDEEMVRWLEETLKGYRGVLLMVTHDRYFLDQVTNRIIEITHGRIFAYDSNYSGFLELKAQREEMALASQRKRQSILRMELEWASRGCRARSTKQRARLERLEALKNTAAPIQDQKVALDTIEARMGKKTLELHQVSKTYGEKKILENLDYIFLKNQKVGIIGPNGCGKSTFLKLLAGEILPDSGSIQVGETIRIGYFAQEETEMDDRQRVIDYVKDIGEYIVTKEGRISASQMLERFLFTPDMQYSPIGKLSGGEKRRLCLLGVLCGNLNVLLLDEAGNNLDIPTLTILEDFLTSFGGIVVAVSHDRYFLDNVADRILAFDGDGHVRQYEGGYTDYLEARRREEGMQEPSGGQQNTVEKKSSRGKDWKQNRPVKLKFSYKEQKEYDTIEETIASLEEKLQHLDQEILANATNSGKLNELTKEKEKLEEELEEKMDRWVYLEDLARRIERGEEA